MKRVLPNLIYGELERQPFDVDERTNGRDWPVLHGAHTMIGVSRLDNIQRCMEDVLARGIPGDFVETGVWRGGAAIFMRAILRAYHIEDRTVWAADSFRGLPEPKPGAYPADEGDRLFTCSELAVSLAEVKANFARYALLDDQVQFLEGWFSDTLPHAPIDRLAVARLDGDMYESTIEALTHLYPKLSRGGYVIVDDFGCIAACRQAVHDYRAAHGVTEPIVEVDWTGVYWPKGLSPSRLPVPCGLTQACYMPTTCLVSRVVRRGSPGPQG